LGPAGIWLEFGDNDKNSSPLAQSIGINNHGAMLLPFVYHKDKVIDTRSLDKLCVWVKENAEKSDITLGRIHELYEQMIDWIDNDIMKGEPLWHNKRKK
jgi:hypothetical protein